MKTETRPALAVALALLGGAFLMSAACGKSGGQRAGNDAGPDGDPGPGIDAGADTAGDDGAAGDGGGGPIVVTLGETAFTFPTPDVSHTLAASVTGTGTTTVTWTSSDTY